MRFSSGSHESDVGYGREVSQHADPHRRGRDEDGRAPQARARGGGVRRRRRGDRDGRVVGGDREPVRRDRPRRHAPRARRLRRLPRAAGQGPMGASPHAHRPRRRPRPRRGAGRRGRRLPRQAVRLLGARGARSRADPARRRGASGGAGVRRPRPRPGEPSRVPRRCRDQPDVEGVRPARALPPPPGRGAVADPDPRARVGLRLQQRLERRRRLRPLPAREGRPALRPRLDRDGARVRLSAARGSQHEGPDPAPAHPDLGGAHGGGPRRPRGVPRHQAGG